MASLVLKMSISLDGNVAPPDGSNPVAGVIGPSRKLPTAAEPMNEIPKVVFSNSLRSADWGETTIAGGDLADSITRLKQERSGGYLLAQGGARFARSLVEPIG